ncbi:MAG TPA: LON peptidase substrate-binding domain-containing protein [Mycobacteriales bacterium]|nr:LON peptidase substrate-binding domain-containing protein [Mycobacteriales bacterium]HVX70684.1 LON peptidase substrate-binding domain-containing protein [Mycobacteriales bacterium]
MADLIALFPLGTVLFPGAPLPLRVFEERYRRLVADLLELPEDERHFGVVAIQSGREVGADGIKALHEVGCLAHVVATHPSADGTFELETIGTRRFRLLEVDEGAAYLRGSVEWLPEPAGDAETLVPIVQERYTRYRRELAALRGATVEAADLPDDPRLLSYVVAATVLADVRDRQGFLEQYDAAARLAVESRWLHREATLLRLTHAVPADRMLEIRFSTS